jgi:DNA-binding SARP family transcriptional activator
VADRLPSPTAVPSVVVADHPEVTCRHSLATTHRSGAVLRLTTLGGLAISDEGRPLGGAARHPRRLSLLALLAAGERGVTRDRVLAYLWPEHDTPHARHALNQALYALRRDLGADVVADRGGTLLLDPAAITSDLAELRAALARAEPERAAALYAGPLLDGVHLRGAPEFERWLEGERDALARGMARVLEQIAGAAAERGDARAAAEWWRRRAALDPLDARAALALMHALIAAGDRTGALRHARAHAELVRRELDAPPDPRIAALAERLRRDAAAAVARRRSSGAAAPDDVVARASVPGDALDGRYRVERELGRGATAATYLAADLRHGRAVALTVLHADLAATLEARRFLRAIRAAARLQHPHVLPLFDSGESAGSLYYVTPYVAGGSLRARLTSGGPLPVAGAARLARSLAAALDHAHRERIVHRGVRPECVLLAGEPEAPHAMLGGFGIARAIDAALEERLTIAGHAVGDPRYASPEQARGEPRIDGRSDLYALGCVLYEMLVGAPPPAGPGDRSAPLVVRRAMAREAPHPRDRRPDVPSWLDAVVARALAPHPADRFATGAEMAAAIGAGPGVGGRGQR